MNLGPWFDLGLGTYLTSNRINACSASDNNNCFITDEDQSPDKRSGRKHEGELWFHLQRAAGPSEQLISSAVLTPPGSTQQFWVLIQVLVGLKHFTDGSLHLLGSQRSLVPPPKTSLYWLVFTHPETAEQKLPFFCQNKTLITVLTRSSDYLLLISANDH